MHSFSHLPFPLIEHIGQTQTPTFLLIILPRIFEMSVPDVALYPPFTKLPKVPKVVVE